MLRSNHRWLWPLFGSLLAVLVVSTLFRVVKAGAEARLRALSATELEARLRATPENSALRYALGQAYARANRHNDAAREFIAVLKREPARPDVLNDLGASYLLQERFYEALVALQAAVIAQPDYALAHANLGRLHLATEMPFTAVQDLERAHRQQPRNISISYDLGEAYQQTLNFRSAERAYLQALRLDPTYTPARVGLGRVLFSLTRYDEASRQLELALQADPRNASALLALARVRMEQNNTHDGWEDALTLLVKAAEADSQMPEVHYELGRVSLRRGDAGAAIEYLKKALLLSPDHPGAMQQMGRALRLAGRTADARRLEAQLRHEALRSREEARLEERVHQFPEDWEAKAELCSLYLETGKTGLAALLLRELEQGAPALRQLPSLQTSLRQQLGSRKRSPLPTPAQASNGGPH